jgi:tetratricopeptide (TPR) repeat protein
MSLQESFDLYQTATDTALHNPREALPIALQALRGFRRSCRCMRIRSGCRVAFIISDLGRLKRSERIILILYRLADGCPCCQPIIDRHFSLVLSAQNRHDEAIERATSALESGPDKALQKLTAGIVYYYAEDFRAARYLSESVQIFPPGSPHHRRSLFCLAIALTFGESKDIDRVAAMLPQLRESYKDVREISQERAYLVWLQGAILAKQAEQLTGERIGHRRRGLLCDARDFFESAFRKYRGLGFTEQASAAWADMMAIQAKLDKSKIPARIITLGCPVASEMDNVKRWAESKRKDAQKILLATLQAMRNRSQCGPSLFSY